MESVGRVLILLNHARVVLTSDMIERKGEGGGGMGRETIYLYNVEFHFYPALACHPLYLNAGCASSG